MGQNIDLNSASVTDKKIKEAQYKQETLQVREKIISENSRGSMVARRLLWLLGKTELCGIRQILDIGSWHLEQSIEFSAVFQHARIDAFEPVPDSYRLCGERLSQLQTQTRDRIRVHNIALTEKTGEVPFYVVDPGTGKNIDEGFSSLFKLNGNFKVNRSSPGPTQRKITVKADTLDKWCVQNNVSEVDIIWIDVQGAELLVFKGAENILRNTRIIMTEVGLKPYYEGHTLKTDIDTFLFENGFYELKGSFELNGFDFEANTIYVKS